MTRPKWYLAIPGLLCHVAGVWFFSTGERVTGVLLMILGALWYIADELVQIKENQSL